LRALEKQEKIKKYKKKSISLSLFFSYFLLFFLIFFKPPKALFLYRTHVVLHEELV